MTRYLVLIYETEREPAGHADPALRAEYDRHRAFIRDRASSIVAGEALQSTATATSLRKDPSGGWAMTDGPFVETTEALGGFYLLEADDLDEAIALAREIPAPLGGVEIRPVMTFDRAVDDAAVGSSV